MKKLMLVLICALAVGCGKDGSNGANGLDGAPGIPGTPGQDGSDGHSIVAQSPGTLPVICTNGGSAVDLYMDMDYDLAVSVGDVFQSTVFACNGLNGADGQDGEDGQDGATGPQGPQGPQGPAGGWSGSVTAVNFANDTTCRNLGGGYYGRKQNSNSSSVRFYTTSNCSGSNIQELSPSSNELFWTSTSNVFSIEGNSSSMNVYRIIIQ